ncbi:MAG: hypothetical protein RSB78_03740, partial [Oscillospiraceae bacterium]
LCLSIMTKMLFVKDMSVHFPYIKVQYPSYFFREECEIITAMGYVCFRFGVDLEFGHIMTINSRGKQKWT